MIKSIMKELLRENKETHLCSKMEPNTLDNGMWTRMKGMEEEFKYGWMGVGMKDIGRKIRLMAEVD